jgi:hypothetical protein
MDVQSKKSKMKLVSEFIFKRKCSEVFSALAASRVSALATKELYFFSDIFRLRYVISRVLVQWRDNYCRNAIRIKTKSSGKFSSIYYRRRRLAVAMIYFKAAVAKPISRSGGGAKSTRKNTSSSLA